MLVVTLVIVHLSCALMVEYLVMFTLSPKPGHSNPKTSHIDNELSSTFYSFQQLSFRIKAIDISLLNKHHSLWLHFFPQVILSRFQTNLPFQMTTSYQYWVILCLSSSSLPLSLSLFQCSLWPIYGASVKLIGHFIVTSHTRHIVTSGKTITNDNKAH